MERAVSQGADAGIIKEMDGFTGAMAVIETGNPGPVTALRFDIDCNDVGEDMDPCRLPVKNGFLLKTADACTPAATMATLPWGFSSAWL